MIVIQNTTKAFTGVQAIKELSLKVAEGEIYGLIGSNGAGKSTTLNMILGFIKPDAGQTLVNNLDSSLKTVEVRKQIGYIPENVNLYPYLTGIENLDYFCKLSGKEYSKSELTHFLAACGLQADAHSKRIETYSKGMRQKVAIAIAYAKHAKVYLLDEPASGLDPLASNELSVLLKKLAAEGAAILMASHDIFRVREICHRIGILKNGVLIKEMLAADVTANELEKIYLNYMKA